MDTHGGCDLGTQWHSLPVPTLHAQHSPAILRRPPENLWSFFGPTHMPDGMGCQPLPSPCPVCQREDTHPVRNCTHHQSPPYTPNTPRGQHTCQQWHAAPTVPCGESPQDTVGGIIGSQSPRPPDAASRVRLAPPKWAVRAAAFGRSRRARRVYRVALHTTDPHTPLAPMHQAVPANACHVGRTTVVRAQPPERLPAPSGRRSM